MDREDLIPRLGRNGSGSHSSGFGSSGSPAGGSGNRGGVSGNDACQQQSHKRYLEGVLSKYTNILQGWQNRYFVLDSEAGQLQYFISEPCIGQKPRGSLPLIGASVTQCDEAPHMFAVYSANGELYKLRAPNSREQQFWMNQLQACARRHSDSCAKGSTSTSSGRSRSFSLLPHPPPASSSPGCHRQPTLSGGPSTIVSITHHKSPAAARRVEDQFPGKLLEVKEVISHVEGQQKTLVHSIESLPTRGPLTSLDQDLLLLKATSAATLSCLGECLNILQQNIGQVALLSLSHGRGSAPDAVPAWPGLKSPSTEHLKNGVLTTSMPQTEACVSLFSEPSQALSNKDLTLSTDIPSLESIHLNEEATDTEENEEEELGVMEEQRSVILHLLSQLKLGMDLTRVVLPTFILEKRSLLEMYANFMAHPDMFLSVTAAVTAEERILRFVEYYLTSFHEGRKGAVAKKPYNPILGESFHCSWEVPCDRVRPARTNCGPALREPSGAERCCDAESPGRYHVRFVAEQVSHHPPISGFYCECQERRMCVNAHVWTKSKFMGMSIGVSMVGEGILYLLEHDEEYIFTLPCAYARSILTVPWVELGGKVSISCAKSGYSATVTFHTKPFYGGKVHRVTAEVKHNPTNTIVCKAQGEWNGTLEFTYSTGETKVIDTSKLPIIKKKIRPVEKQGLMESRRLWHPVTEALKEGNVDTATKHKHLLEERQRSEERQRAASNTQWKPRYFIKEGEGWVYHRPLWKAY